MGLALRQKVLPTRVGISNKGRAALGMSESDNPHLVAIRPHLNDVPSVAIGGVQRYILFFSFTDGTHRAKVITSTGASVDEAWQTGTRQVMDSGVPVHWLRVDWVDTVNEYTWSRLSDRLKDVKRNYTRRGISLDANFGHAFLETELNANAMLYGDGRTVHAVINEVNFRRYARERHGLSNVEFNDHDKVWLFTTKGIFVDADHDVAFLSQGGLNTGRRHVEELTPELLTTVIDSGSRYLASQVLEDGRFIYGWHPCFDLRINGYNSLRHASSVYAMLEAWEVTRDSELDAAIRQSLSYLVEELIRLVTIPAGDEVAFVVDPVGETPTAEIKLGANAVAILALVKYMELHDDQQYLEVAEKLALGIICMQHPDTGVFVHVLNYPELTLKSAQRIIYYDGEAAFALMRLYGLTRNKHWLSAVEKAFESFIAREHWRAHDHWLSYCVNELTLHRPNKRYFQFGIQNFKDYLKFIGTRITTFPTLLELTMAATKMIERIGDDRKYSHLLDEVDLPAFYAARDYRARYLLNGYFWPELAMYYENPAKIVGSFFIRHHSFRIRIDDVEHYLSGLIAYRDLLLGGERSEA